MKLWKFRKNTVYVLTDGRMFKALEAPEEGLACVLFVDKDEPCYLEPASLDIMTYCVSPAANISFYASRSIHIRLNRMTKV